MQRPGSWSPGGRLVTGCLVAGLVVGTVLTAGGDTDVLEDQAETAAATCASALHRSDRFDTVTADQPEIVDSAAYRKELAGREADRPGFVNVFKAVCRRPNDDAATRLADLLSERQSAARTRSGGRTAAGADGERP